jgi:hypothetical protein
LLAWDHTGSIVVAGLKARRQAELRLWKGATNAESAAAA